jgi:(2R)-phospho-3-sulfolactate synthase (ComA)
MIRAVGPGVNLGNVAAADVIGVETLRRGLRGDTLLDLTTGGPLRTAHSAYAARPARPAAAADSTPSAA